MTKNFQGKIMNLAKKIILHFFPPKRRRKELRFVSYAEGDKLVKEGWTIAREEDSNSTFGHVFLELLEEK